MPGSSGPATVPVEIAAVDQQVAPGGIAVAASATIRGQAQNALNQAQGGETSQNRLWRGAISRIARTRIFGTEMPKNRCVMPSIPTTFS